MNKVSGISEPLLISFFYHGVKIEYSSRVFVLPTGVLVGSLFIVPYL